MHRIINESVSSQGACNSISFGKQIHYLTVMIYQAYIYIYFSQVLLCFTLIAQKYCDMYKRIYTEYYCTTKSDANKQSDAK